VSGCVLRPTCGAQDAAVHLAVDTESGGPNEEVGFRFLLVAAAVDDIRINGYATNRCETVNSLAQSGHHEDPVGIELEKSECQERWRGVSRHR
jgi:hypothetical protein